MDPKQERLPDTADGFEFASTYDESEPCLGHFEDTGSHLTDVEGFSSPGIDFVGSPPIEV